MKKSNKSNNKKGFTLVELVIVVAVIAILSAILIPTIGSVVKEAKEAAVKTDLRTVITNHMVDRDETTGEIKDNNPVEAGYFFYVEDGTTITYVLYWTGNEVEIKTATETEGHYTIFDKTITLDSNYELKSFDGKFYKAVSTGSGSDAGSGTNV